MRGDNLRLWFDLFAGMNVYKGGEPAKREDLGWLDVNDLELQFRLGEGRKFNGRKYDPADAKQRSALRDATINSAVALCYVGLLERRRRFDPPALDYRVTRLGRWVDGWGYGSKPGFRKRAVFFAIDSFFSFRTFWKIVGAVAAVATVLDAFDVFDKAIRWMSASPALSLVAQNCGAQIRFGLKSSAVLYHAVAAGLPPMPALGSWFEVSSRGILALVSAVIGGVLTGAFKFLQAVLDRRAIVRWLRVHTKDEPGESHVDTATLAKGTRLPEERVRGVHDG